MIIINDLWKEGENKAAEYLINKGYRILCRNYRCRFGEIDIIAVKDKILRFIEVKTRSNLNYGLPSEAVDRKKIQHIQRSGCMYMQQDTARYEGIKIEIIEILRNNNQFYIRHIDRICIDDFSRAPESDYRWRL